MPLRRGAGLEDFESLHFDLRIAGVLGLDFTVDAHSVLGGDGAALEELAFEGDDDLAGGVLEDVAVALGAGGDDAAFKDDGSFVASLQGFCHGVNLDDGGGAVEAAEIEEPTTAAVAGAARMRDRAEAMMRRIGYSFFLLVGVDLSVVIPGKILLLEIIPNSKCL